ITNESLETILINKDYVNNGDLSLSLADYLAKNDLNTILGDYLLKADLTTELDAALNDKGLITNETLNSVVESSVESAIDSKNLLTIDNSISIAYNQTQALVNVLSTSNSFYLNISNQAPDTSISPTNQGFINGFVWVDKSTNSYYISQGDNWEIIDILEPKYITRLAIECRAGNSQYNYCGGMAAFKIVLQSGDVLKFIGYSYKTGLVTFSDSLGRNFKAKVTYTYTKYNVESSTTPDTGLIYFFNPTYMPITDKRGEFYHKCGDYDTSYYLYLDFNSQNDLLNISEIAYISFYNVCNNYIRKGVFGLQVYLGNQTITPKINIAPIAFSSTYSLLKFDFIDQTLTEMALT
ncbi:hypothetical protein, partial [Campylobacter sp. LR264d]|uniref:hypothetical protein n=1 Tax=Campylobacter sp. LR264d TaxID=2593544 RepID=UPI001681723E